MLFPAQSGKDGKYITCSSKVAISTAKQLFSLYDATGVEVDEKRQRDLLPERTRKVEEYILSNPDEFVFPGLLCIVEKFIFTPLLEDYPSLGLLEIPDDVKILYFVDGQGRFSGSCSAADVLESIGESTLDIKFLESRGLEKDQQIFCDVNQTPSKPSASINIMMDSRSIRNTVATAVLKALPELQQFVDYQKTSVGPKSEFLWTLNQFANFVMKATGFSRKEFDEKLEDRIHRGKAIRALTAFLENWVTNHELMLSIVEGKVSPQEAKATTLLPTALFLEALGMYAKQLFLNSSEKAAMDWSPMPHLNKVDLKKTNKNWIGRGYDITGEKLTKNTQNVNAVAATLILAGGCLDLPKELAKVDQKVRAARKELGIEPTMRVVA